MRRLAWQGKLHVVQTLILAGADVNAARKVLASCVELGGWTCDPPCF